MARHAGDDRIEPVAQRFGGVPFGEPVRQILHQLAEFADFMGQRLGRGARLLQLGTQFGLADNLRRALLDVSCSSTAAKFGILFDYNDGL